MITHLAEEARQQKERGWTAKETRQEKELEGAMFDKISKRGVKQHKGALHRIEGVRNLVRTMRI